jgi:hypothetical protein
MNTTTITNKQPPKKCDGLVRIIRRRDVMARVSPFRKLLFRMALILMLALSLGSTVAGENDRYRVHYSIRGSGRDITILARSSDEARRTVADMFPDAVVTGAHRARR